MIYSSREGECTNYSGLSSLPTPLSRDHTGYFGLPSLAAPFLDWAPAGADHTSFSGPPGGGGRTDQLFWAARGVGRVDQLFWVARGVE